MFQDLLGFLGSSFVSDSERLQVSREVSKLKPLLTGLLNKDNITIDVAAFSFKLFNNNISKVHSWQRSCPDDNAPCL